MARTRTAKELAQLAVGAVRLANGDPNETQRILLDDLGLTDEELIQAFRHLESDQPILGS